MIATHEPGVEQLRAHLDSLYLRDDAERLLAVNQWDGGAVPRFHLARSGSGKLWRFRADLPAGLMAALDALCAAEPAALSRSPQQADAYLDLLTGHAPVTAVRQGPFYLFPDPPAPLSSFPIVQITAENADLLRPAMPDWLPDVHYRSPFFAALCEQQAVAVCASVRITGRCHQAGVETAPDFRRRGYGVAVVAAWAAEVRKRGAQPVYSTTWDNHASRAVAAALGLTLAGVDFQVY